MKDCKHTCIVPHKNLVCIWQRHIRGLLCGVRDTDKQAYIMFAPISLRYQTISNILHRSSSFISFLLSFCTLTILLAVNANHNNLLSPASIHMGYSALLVQKTFKGRLNLGTDVRGGSRAVQGRLDGAVVRGTDSAALLADMIVALVIHDGHANVGRVDVAVAPDEESTEAGLGDEVKDGVEDGLGIGRNDVATLAETPGNWVQDPQECSQGTTVQEALGDLRAVASGVAAGLPDKLVDNVEKRNAANDKVRPLVPADNESTNQTGDNHDLVNEYGPEDRGPRHASSEEKVEQQKRSRNEPIDVADVEDLAVFATNHRVVALKLDLYRCETQVGAHGEVGNACYEHNTRSDVVEQTVLALLAEGKTNESEPSEAHGRTDGEVQVRATGCDGNVGRTTVHHVACSTLESAVSLFDVVELTIDVESIVA